MPKMMVAEAEGVAGITAWCFPRGVKQQGVMAERRPLQDIPRIIKSLRRSDEEGSGWRRHVTVVEFPQHACLVTDGELSFLLLWQGSLFDSCTGIMNVWKESANMDSDEGWEVEEAEEDEDADILEVMAGVLQWLGVDEEEMVKEAQEDMDENSLRYVQWMVCEIQRQTLKGVLLAKRYRVVDCSKRMRMMVEAKVGPEEDFHMVATGVPSVYRYVNGGGEMGEGESVRWGCEEMKATGGHAESYQICLFQQLKAREYKLV